MNPWEKKIDELLERADEMHDFIQYLLQERTKLMLEIEEKTHKIAELEQGVAHPQETDQSSSTINLEDIRKSIDVYIQEIDTYLHRLGEKEPTQVI